MAEAALIRARAIETEITRGEIRGPLHGVPIAVKDLCWTQGVPTAAGMTIYKDFRPTEDATVVRKLYSAGAIILGKLQLTEGAWAEHHPQIPAPVNPWNAAHWSGASSSGSGVATAAGLCYGSLGSDTGGSIRFPARPMVSLASSLPGAESAAMACSSWRRRSIISGRWHVARRIAARYSVLLPEVIRTTPPQCWARCRTTSPA
jgi:hypothetical protein